MHLLATRTGVVDGAAEAADLAQAPGDILVLSAADSELAALARAWDRLDTGPTLRPAVSIFREARQPVDIGHIVVLTKIIGSGAG